MLKAAFVSHQTRAQRTKTTRSHSHRVLLCLPPRRSLFGHKQPPSFGCLLCISLIPLTPRSSSSSYEVNPLTSTFHFSKSSPESSEILACPRTNNHVTIALLPYVITFDFGSVLCAMLVVAHSLLLSLTYMSLQHKPCGKSNTATTTHTHVVEDVTSTIDRP